MKEAPWACSVIVFTDNDAALMSMIRGVSKNGAGARIVNAVHSLVDLCGFVKAKRVRASQVVLHRFVIELEVFMI